MKSRFSHMSSSFWAVWFEEKGRFRGEFEAAEVFPAEDSMIQVRSRGNASHFVERKSPSSPISVQFLILEHQSSEQKHNAAMTCFVCDGLLCFCSGFEATSSNKGSGVSLASST